MLLKLLTFITLFVNIIANEKILAVVGISQHGQINPEKYFNEPYDDISHWSDGFGQLTNVGKMQHFELEKWFREIYNDFLPRNYSSNDIYVMASDVDQALMSATVNMAGLYTPEDQQIWNEDLKWQPIPVHTRPTEDDYLLNAGSFKCPLRDELFKKFKESDVYKQAVDKRFFEFLTHESGSEISTLRDVKKLYLTLLMENTKNHTLPYWAKEFILYKLEKSAAFEVSSMAHTDELAQLSIGPILNEIQTFFLGVINGTEIIKIRSFR